MNTTATTQATYNIPVHRLDDLSERLDGLNRRAKKLGLASIVSMELVGAPYVHKYPRTEGESMMIHDWTGAVTLQNVIVHGVAPKLAGWTLVSAIDHGEAAGDIIKSILGKDIPAEYRTRGPLCDHCNAARKRKLTFVCQHDDGQWKQIGSTCLADFTGHKDPEAIARLCSWMGELAGFCGDLDDIGQFGCRVKPEFMIPSILRAAAAAVRIQGFYVSRAKSQEAADKGEDLVTTSSRVNSLLSCRTDADEKRILGKEGYIAQDNEIAAATLTFVRDGGIQGEGDYAYNMNILFKDPGAAIGVRNVGLVGSAVAAYLRTQARVAAEKAQGTEHIGTVGKREVFTLTVISTMVRDGAYGTSTIVRFRDAAGNPAVWFASGDKSDLKEGMTAKFKATVKKHDLYKGRVSTILARVQQDLSDEPAALVVREFNEVGAQVTKVVPAGTVKEALKRAKKAAKASHVVAVEVSLLDKAALVLIDLERGYMRATFDVLSSTEGPAYQVGMAL